MKNYEAHPTSTASFPKVNVARHRHNGKNRGRGHNYGVVLDLIIVTMVIMITHLFTINGKGFKRITKWPRYKN